MKRFALAILCLLPSCDSGEVQNAGPTLALPAPDDSFLLGDAATVVAMSAGAGTVEVAARRGERVTYVIIANTEPVATEITLPLTTPTARVVDVLTGSVVAENVSGALELAVAGYDARVLALLE